MLRDRLPEEADGIGIAAAAGQLMQARQPDQLGDLRVRVQVGQFIAARHQRVQHLVVI